MVTVVQMTIDDLFTKLNVKIFYVLRYSGNANAALKMLNKARKDPVHGSKALIAMIDIYVNPTGGVLGGDALDSSSSGDSMANGSGGKADYRDLTLNTADTLIQVLFPDLIT